MPPSRRARSWSAHACSPPTAGARRWRSPSPTAATACRRKRSGASSSPSTPPRRPGAARASGSPSWTTSCARTAARSWSSRARAGARRCACASPWRRDATPPRGRRRHRHLPPPGRRLQARRLHRDRRDRPAAGARARRGRAGRPRHPRRPDAGDGRPRPAARAARTAPRSPGGHHDRLRLDRHGGAGDRPGRRRLSEPADGRGGAPRGRAEGPRPRGGGSGLFAEADGGTIFLDEIGDVSPALQAKLLRVLQEHQIRPVGGSVWRAVDVRVIAATNRELAAAVEEGRFREDLYYRLKVVTLQLPPLRERREDIPLLVDHLVRRAARECRKAVTGVSEQALAWLRAYHWPGNVRELAHVLERGVALAQQEVLTAEDLPDELRRPGPAPARATPEDRPTLAELKRRYVHRVFEESGGNVSRAAQVLGVDRRSLYRMLQRYGVTPRGGAQG